MGLIDRVKQVLLKPNEAWGQIKEEQTTIKEIYTSYAGILAAIPPIAGFIGMSIIGVSFFRFSYRVPFVSALSHAVVNYVLSLVGLYIIALIIDALAPHFESQKSMTNAFKTATYSSTPNWVASILLVIPALSPIVMLASLYSLYLLYLGLPVLMETPKEKVLGYVILVIVVSIVVFIITGAAARLVLPGVPMVAP